jgi:raffinose/stachyose/melibiose transport system permease protein
VGVQIKINTFLVKTQMSVGAGLVIATIPTVMIYIVLSNNVQKSLAVGAVKG